MNEIITLLRAIKAPDRDVDIAIALAEGWTHQKMKGDQRPYWRAPGVTDWWMREPNGPPRYTHDINTAIGMRPEGSDMRLSIGAGGGTVALITFPGNPSVQLQGISLASPAVAILIAVFKYRRAKDNEQAQG
jgi:hypothetical protein